jgi:hypothetical protein
MGEMEIANQIVVGYPEGQYDFGDVECMELW